MVLTTRKTRTNIGYNYFKDGSIRVVPWTGVLRYGAAELAVVELNAWTERGLRNRIAKKIRKQRRYWDTFDATYTCHD